jgi:hypothetical protein
MQNEPGRLLCHLQVFGEGGASDAFRVIGDHPKRHKPLPQRQLGIVEDRPDLD